MLSGSLLFRNTYAIVPALKFIRCDLIKVHAETWTQFTLNAPLLLLDPRLDLKCGGDAYLSSSLSFPRLQRHEVFYKPRFFCKSWHASVFTVKMMLKELGRELGSAGLSWGKYAPEHQSEQHQRCGWEKPHTPCVLWDISFSSKKAQWSPHGNMGLEDEVAKIGATGALVNSYK